MNVKENTHRGPGSQDGNGTEPNLDPVEDAAEEDGAGDRGEEDVAKKSKKRKKKEKEKKAKGKGGGSGRGVETMFRTAYRTHLDLSSIADNKANIMISINGIIISILLATIYPSLAHYRGLLIPSTLLLLGCLCSLVAAVLAARPRVTKRALTIEDVRAGRANLLFFGNFISLEEEEFVSGMWELIDDRERNYTTMMRDLYGLGLVLEKKYRLLRISYTVFMVGLVVGVLGFLIAFAISGQTPPGP